ncbi:hypothetical protein ACFWNW_05940 [Streptomyces seoulensis]|uniref:hypothetical protein n=1 Tax=Streptomyces seoulensis TaxID=73044 RepID=UPI0036463BBF
MDTTRTALGPLELVDERWVLGDAERDARVEFHPEGLYSRARDGAEDVLPWSRIMLGMRLTLGGRYPGRTGQLALLEKLLGQTVRAGEVARLADGDWLGRVVARLAEHGRWARGGVQREAREAEKQGGV